VLLSSTPVNDNSGSRPGPELRVVSGQRNESQPQEDQSSEEAHQRYTS